MPYIWSEESIQNCSKSDDEGPEASSSLQLSVSERSCYLAGLLHNPQHKSNALYPSPHLFAACCCSQALHYHWPGNVTEYLACITLCSLPICTFADCLSFCPQGRVQLGIWKAVVHNCHSWSHCFQTEIHFSTHRWVLQEAADSHIILPLPPPRPTLNFFLQPSVPCCFQQKTGCNKRKGSFSFCPSTHLLTCSDEDIP